ncbi:hypothetical protein TNCV_1427031 [Trichonephila clavipes]|nr:hypothetical protein TNCV_1427031 [Trichonephila clavipes]
MDHIYVTFTPNRVVNRDQFGLSLNWLSKSHDMLVSGYFLWAAFKSKVYRNSPNSLQELLQNISDENLPTTTCLPGPKGAKK